MTAVDNKKQTCTNFSFSLSNWRVSVNRYRFWTSLGIFTSPNWKYLRESKSNENVLQASKVAKHPNCMGYTDIVIRAKLYRHEVKQYKSEKSVDGLHICFVLGYCHVDHFTGWIYLTVEKSPLSALVQFSLGLIQSGKHGNAPPSSQSGSQQLPLKRFLNSTKIFCSISGRRLTNSRVE